MTPPKLVLLIVFAIFNGEPVTSTNLTKFDKGTIEFQHGLNLCVAYLNNQNTSFNDGNIYYDVFALSLGDFRMVKKTLAVVRSEPQGEFTKPDNCEVTVSQHRGSITTGSRTEDVFFEIWKLNISPFEGFDNGWVTFNYKSVEANIQLKEINKTLTDKNHIYYNVLSFTGIPYFHGVKNAVAVIGSEAPRNFEPSAIYEVLIGWRRGILGDVNQLQKTPIFFAILKPK